LYEPNKNDMLIDYTNPFISSMFSDDECYVRLCENYDYYTSIEPRFGDAINSNWEKDTGKKWLNPNYLVMFLDNVEIQWIHETNPTLLLKKFKSRLEKSKEHEPLFLWCDAEIFNIHTEEERENLVKRFNRNKYKSIFLTKYRKEEYRNNTTIVKFIPEWEGKSQYDRRRDTFMYPWHDQLQLAGIFKKIINEFESI
jgi:hypothetical protein